MFNIRTPFAYMEKTFNKTNRRLVCAILKSKEIPFDFRESQFVEIKLILIRLNKTFEKHSDIMQSVRYGRPHSSTPLNIGT